MAALQRQRKVIAAAEKKLKALFSGVLSAYKTAVLDSLKSLSKAAIPASWNPPAFTLTADERDALVNALQVVAQDGVYQATQQLLAHGWADVNVSVVLQANQGAIGYAQLMGADLVTQISDATRNALRVDIAQALTDGLSNDELAAELEDAYTFSSERAEVIARTETAFADSAGNLSVYRHAGVEKKRWVLGSDSCDICADNEADGDIPLGDLFSDGSYSAPAHPNCTCDVIPVLDDDPDGSDDE